MSAEALTPRTGRPVQLEIRARQANGIFSVQGRIHHAGYPVGAEHRKRF